MNMQYAKMTPKTIAHLIAVDWIDAAFYGKTADLADLTPARQRDVRIQLAKIRTRLMDEAKLDGLPLDLERMA
jgi:hypothetical protein